MSLCYMYMSMSALFTFLESPMTVVPYWGFPDHWGSETRFLGVQNATQGWELVCSWMYVFFSKRTAIYLQLVLLLKKHHPA